jgi:hypothetical protein
MAMASVNLRDKRDLTIAGMVKSRANIPEWTIAHFSV